MIWARRSPRPAISRSRRRRPRAACRARSPFRRGAEAEVLGHAHLGRQRHRLGQVAERAPHRRVIVGDRAARQHRRPARRRQEAGEDPHHRRLAGAVRPQQADDLAAPHLERHVVQRGRPTAPGRPYASSDPRTLSHVWRKVTPGRDRARIRRPRRAGGRPRAAASARSPGPARRRRAPCAAGCDGRGRWSDRRRRTADRRPAASRAARRSPSGAAPARLRPPLAGAAGRRRHRAVVVVERQAAEQAQDRGRQRRLLRVRSVDVGQIGRLDLDAAEIAADVVGQLRHRALHARREVRLGHLQRQRERLGVGRARRREVARRPPRRRPAAPRSSPRW